MDQQPVQQRGFARLNRNLDARAGFKHLGPCFLIRVGDIDPSPIIAGMV